MSQTPINTPAAQYQPFYGSTEASQGQPSAQPSAAPHPYYVAQPYDSAAAARSAAAPLIAEQNRQPVYAPMDSTFAQHCTQLQTHAIAFAVLTIPAFACCWATYWVGIPLGFNTFFLAILILLKLKDPNAESAYDKGLWNKVVFLAIGATVLGGICSLSAVVWFFFWSGFAAGRMIFASIGLGVAISTMVIGYLTLRRANDVRLHHLAEKPSHVAYASNANTKYVQVI